MFLFNFNFWTRSTATTGLGGSVFYFKLCQPLQSFWQSPQLTVELLGCFKHGSSCSWLGFPGVSNFSKDRLCSGRRGRQGTLSPLWVHSRGRGCWWWGLGRSPRRRRTHRALGLRCRELWFRSVRDDVSHFPGQTLLYLLKHDKNVLLGHLLSQSSTKKTGLSSWD